MSTVKYYHPSSRFNSLLNNFFQQDFSRPLNGEQLERSPKVNILEREDHFLLELAAPGLSKADFNLSLDKNQLTIKVEKSPAEGEDKPRYTRREFDYQQFSRQFHLPDTIDVEAIAAQYENGILLVKLPKKEAVLPRQIEIAE
ncbi:MAG: Hsp20/alpha crystallin family protein [Bacteroidota bacterium]